MLLVVLLVVLVGVVKSEKNSRYFTYQEGVIPAKNLNNEDFMMLNASEIIIDMLDTDSILEKYKFHSEYLGFIEKKSLGKVSHVLVKRQHKGFKGEIGTFVRSTGDIFYEQKPIDGSYFLNRYFGFNSYPTKKRIGSCLVSKSLLGSTLSMREQCELIPRCLGYIENECLYSSIKVNDEFVVSSKPYFEKKLRHDIFVWIDENTIVFSLIIGAGYIVVALYPKFISRFIKKLLKKRRGYKPVQTEAIAF